MRVVQICFVVNQASACNFGTILTLFADHLTNFALLISTEDPSDKCGSSPIQNEVIAWLSLAFLLLAILIFFAFAVATELCYRKKAANKRSFLESLQQPGSEAQSFQPHNRDSAIRIN
mmetsp:Transcript_13669/g.17211  ORF Transcript_13669/g.17211 Transcript_13669/m.17211 type:complete len:118 (+) Transcript_13669:1797-2150(+)